METVAAHNRAIARAQSAIVEIDAAIETKACSSAEWCNGWPGIRSALPSEAGRHRGGLFDSMTIRARALANSTLLRLLGDLKKRRSKPGSRSGGSSPRT